MQKDIKCFYCEFLGLISKHSGTCFKDKQQKQIAVVRNCEKFKLAPLHSVNWRREEIKK